MSSENEKESVLQPDSPSSYSAQPSFSAAFMVSSEKNNYHLL